MRKSDAVAAMGPSTLLLPAWIKAALVANDRLKLYLTVLQAAAAHAEHPEREALDLGRETASAGAEGRWLQDVPAVCSRVNGAFVIPELRRLAQRLVVDLGVMARPLLDPHREKDDPGPRVKHWLDWLAAIGSKNSGGETLTSEQLRLLTDGKRGTKRDGKRGDVQDGHDFGADSFHLLVMDLHKQLNHLAGSLSNEEIGGAHVWQLQPTDRPRVEAFMRGLNRTAPLKFDHPGLDTAATRDGKRLLLQNDIGTNDAHVLVVQVEGKSITLNYSDLHRPRFEFFQTLLGPFGAK